MYTKTKDGSIVDETGKVLYFSIERFIQEICEGDCCFICGASPETKSFNDEHILPQWLLGRYGLHARSITLPNFTQYTYGQYVVPCCEECNSRLGREIEEPVRELIENGYDAIVQHLAENGPWLFFVWQSLVFIKTHLKDKSLRLHLDRRKGAGMISDFYEWERFHHIHCVARSLYTKARLTPEVLGTFLVVPAQVDDRFEKFDYGDLYASASTYLRLDNICLISVLDDSNAGFSYHYNLIQKLKGPLSPIQIRELFAHLSFVNLKLKERPVFASVIDPNNGYEIIGARPPELILDDTTSEEFGQMLYSCVHQYLNPMPSQSKEDLHDQVYKGEVTFLFDSDGNFSQNSMIFDENSPNSGSS